MGTVTLSDSKIMLTLLGNAVSQTQWRFENRFDLQMLVQSARGPLSLCTHCGRSLPWFAAISAACECTRSHP
jgi:hypothetical protein